MTDVALALALVHARRVLRFARRRGLAVAAVAGLWLAGCSGLEQQQRKWIFQATAVQAATAEDMARLAESEDMEDAWISHVSAATGASIRLHALWARNDDPEAPLLLYLHGARRDVEQSTWRIGHMRDLGFSVLAVDYRGFGYSTDELPSEAGVVEDAMAAWRWLGQAHPKQRRYVYGHSLGGAVAVQLAARLAAEPDAGALQGVILESTFTSIGDVFRSFSWGWLPITALITERFDSLAAIERVKAPLLVVHGSDDGIVPAKLGRALYEKASAPKRFVLVDGGTHSSTQWQGIDQYKAALHDLFGVGSAS